MPITFYYRTADTIDHLVSNDEYTTIDEFDSINKTINCEKYTEFTRSTEDTGEALIYRLTVSTNKPFNLIGDITEFMDLEVGEENYVKPFQNNENLKKLINFKINYTGMFDKDGGKRNNGWEFWSKQFSGCTNLESADIVFDLPTKQPDEYINEGFTAVYYAKLTDLFTGCSSLSSINVNDISSSFIEDASYYNEETNVTEIYPYSSNDWLDVSSLPNSGILILPIIYKISDVENISSGFTQNTEDIILEKDENNNQIKFKHFVNNRILPEDCISSLLIKDWTIKFK